MLSVGPGGRGGVGDGGAGRRRAAHRDGAGRRARPGPRGRAGGLASADGGAPAGQGALRPRDHAGAGRGLPGRRRAAARRARSLRAGGLRPDRVPRPRPARRGRDPGARRDRPGAGGRTGAGVAGGGRARPRPRRERAPARRHRRRRDAVTAHSDKEGAAPTFKRGYGHHPLWAFADHGPDGTGEPLAVLLRPGNAGSNTAADHVRGVADALRQLPGRRRGRSVLVRADAAGATHEFLRWLTARGRALAYSVGFPLPNDAAAAIAKIPADAWRPAYDADGEVREGAWVAELTGLLDLSRWPAGMRVIVRKERPHPGAQLRLTDVDGHRLTAFATNTPPGGPGR